MRTSLSRIKKLAAEKMAVPPLLKLAAEKGGFYKAENGQLHYLGTDGAYHALKRGEGVLLLADIKRASKPILKNGSASLWDLGDGVACLEFHSKMNAIDPDTLAMVKQSVDHVGKKMKALVIHNEGDDFSVGANLGVALIAAKAKQFWVIDKMVTLGQSTLKRLKYAKFPVVSAPAGKALGGGCEVLLHSHHVQAHAETYPGLVEVGVGLLPAWGGSTELTTRAHLAQKARKLPGGPMPPVAMANPKIPTINHQARMRAFRFSIVLLPFSSFTRIERTQPSNDDTANNASTPPTSQ